MPDYSASNPSTWQDCHYDYYFIMLASICFVSGILSLALNPYFKRHVVKPIERPKKENEGTEGATNAREMTSDSEPGTRVEILGA